MSTSFKDPVNENTKLSVNKLMQFFDGYEFHEEAKMIHRFFKTISQFENDDFVFMPKNLTDYLQHMRDDQDASSRNNYNFLFKQIPEVGSDVITKNDLINLAKEYKIQLTKGEIDGLIDMASGEKHSRVLN